MRILDGSDGIGLPVFIGSVGAKVTLSEPIMMSDGPTDIGVPATVIAGWPLESVVPSKYRPDGLAVIFDPPMVKIDGWTMGVCSPNAPNMILPRFTVV